MDSYIQVIKELAAGGFATFLIAILVAGKYRIWMFTSYHDEMIVDKDKQIAAERAEKEQWRALALETRNLTDRSVSALNKVISTTVNQ